MNNDKPIKLSKRQMQIVVCLSKGMKNKDVANELKISVNTVAAHVFSLYKKLNVKSRKDALLAADHLELLEKQDDAYERVQLQQRDELVDEMYQFIKGLESLSSKDRRRQGCLVTKYEMFFHGVYNYSSL